MPDYNFMPDMPKVRGLARAKVYFLCVGDDGVQASERVGGCGRQPPVCTAPLLIMVGPNATLQAEYDRLRKLVIELVLATDVSVCVCMWVACLLRVQACACSKLRPLGAPAAHRTTTRGDPHSTCHPSALTTPVR